MAEIIAKKIKVGDLFSESFQFKIPYFQRPLSWRLDNFEALFEDIYNAFTQNQEEYFLGTIILQEENDKVYYIIDGQQRLTALLILLAVIRDNTDSEDLKNSIKKALYQEEDKYKNLPAAPRIKMWEDLANLEDFIYKVGKTKDYLKEIAERRIKYIDDKDPKYRLYEAIFLYNQKYKDIFQENKNSEGEFVKYLYNNVYVVYISTKDLPYAIQLFNVINTRGLPLTTADILKAENLSLIDESERHTFSKKWREIENNIGRENVEKVIEFIRTLKLKTKAKASIYKEYNDLIFKKEILKRGKDFIIYFDKISEIYRDYILEPDDLRVENKYKNLVKLMKEFIPFDDWVPPLISYCEKFKESHLLKFLYALERKTVIEWIVGFTPTKRILSLNKIIELIESKNNPEEVITELNIPKDLKEEFKKKIDGKDFGSEDFAKYLLLRIDLEKWDPENFSGYSGTITIEHILPQNPSEKSEWVKIFTDKEREEWTNKIGNLVLLGRRKNSKARNYDFKEKKEAYFFKGGATPFKITENIKNYKTWTTKELEERQNELVGELLKLYFGD